VIEGWLKRQAAAGLQEMETKQRELDATQSTRLGGNNNAVYLEALPRKTMEVDAN
jgi:hypothetical protein